MKPTFMLESDVKWSLQGTVSSLLLDDAKHFKNPKNLKSSLSMVYRCDDKDDNTTAVLLLWCKRVGWHEANGAFAGGYRELATTTNGRPSERKEQ